MDRYDEPILLGSSNEGTHIKADPATQRRIRVLLETQPFGVLCTQGQGQPYGSVIAYAPEADLTSVTFATPKATRKFHLLSTCDAVALVVDSRASFPEDMMKVEALTATGRAVQLESGPEFDHFAALLTQRHPQLRSFVRAPSSALFRIDVVRYLHVSRFQEVHQWIPKPSG